MRTYVGIDLGTTNTKIIVVDENGIEKIIKIKTPKRVANAVEYFDLDKLDHSIEKIISQLNEEYDIAGLSCTSFGESVVPVANGRKLHDPIVWYDTCTKTTQQKYEKIVDKLAPYEISGSRDIYYFSLYKILYMYENSIVRPNEVEHWLPVCSYVLYRLTKNAVWDMTQACRSHMVDVHNRRWNKNLIDHFEISQDQLGKLDYTGSFVGYYGKIPVFLAGHDHLTGTFGLVSLYGSDLIYDSMGTASLITAISHEKDGNLHMKEPFMKNGGLVGIGFKDGQYYLASGVRYHGKLIELVLRTFGMTVSSKRFRLINEKIKSMPQRVNFYIYSNGDNVVGENCQGINFLEIPADCTPEEILQTVYQYLSYTSRVTIENLNRYVGDLPIIVGGALINNDVFMKYKASMLCKDLYYLNTTELTALGAAVSAIKGSHNEQAFEALKAKTAFQKIVPDYELCKQMNELYIKMSQGYNRLLR
ncbi:FGGY-family carbohydrate kinase [Thermotoga profunda]|uniref:FGGY-family carbohydrate kinase n=1 Tax=Thermotoga profunda TaxID=1508420 RepID=UPI0005972407|nr:FGGY family carbohydrate kinase [Thermotoga profunda]